MKTIQINLFGGRIDCVKFALKLAIEKFEKSKQHDMTLIYRDILQEIEQKNKELELYEEN